MQDVYRAVVIMTAEREIDRIFMSLGNLIALEVPELARVKELAESLISTVEVMDAEVRMQIDQLEGAKEIGVSEEVYTEDEIDYLEEIPEIPAMGEEMRSIIDAIQDSESTEEHED